MKTGDLIGLLTAGEKKEFLRQLQAGRNKHAAAIFRFFLREHTGKRDFLPELYRSVFGKQRTPANDFLLRNELRLLNRKLEIFFAMQQVGRAKDPFESEKSWLFLNALLDRSSYALFEKEWMREFRRCEEEGDIASLLRLAELHLDYSVRHRRISPSGLAGLLSELERIELLSRRLQEHRIARTRLYRAQLARQRSESDRSVPLEEIPSPHFSISPENDPFLGYAESARKAYLSRGEETIAYMQDALSFLEKCLPGELDIRRARTQLRAQIALEYFLRGQYAEADRYYKALLPDAPAVNDPMRLASLYLNYISNLVRMEKFADALRFIAASEKNFAPFPEFRQRIASLAAMCCIYTGKIREAKAFISAEIAEAKQDTLVYLRLALAIVFYLQKKYELAVRELGNLQHSLRQAETRFARYAQIARLFIRAIEIQDEARQKKTRLTLRKDFAAFAQSAGTYEILPVQWIFREIGKAI